VWFAGSSSFEFIGKRRGFLKYEGNSMVHQCERGIAGVRSTGYDRQPLSSPFKEGIADRSPEEGGAGSVVHRFLFIRMERKKRRAPYVCTERGAYRLVMPRAPSKESMSAT
jgi:hypothetical protein